MRRVAAEEYLDGFDAILAEVSRTGRRMTRQELDQRGELGERAAEDGVSQRQVVSAYVTAAREAWSGLPGVRQGATARDVTVVAESVLDALGQAVEAVCAGHSRAQVLAVRQEVAARREFVDDLLYGRSDLGRLAERAERFGLRLAHDHVVAVAVGPEPYGDTHRVTRQVESALTARFGDRRILLTTKDGRLVCIAPGSRDDMVTCFAEQARAAAGGGSVAIGRAH
ncbi:MAG TPA: PucR family transcriptional regulator, partial [Yinghuangia sp.]|nr:PucR family transcriptional regulator [Yinghuangia sp.]